MKIIGLTLVIASILTGIIWWIAQPDPPASPASQGLTATPAPPIARARPASSTPTPADQLSPPAATPTATPSITLDSGSDESPPPAADPTVDQAAITRTTTAFVQGWLTRNPKKRVRLLTPVTTDQLLDGLADTRPDNIPKTKTTGPPTIIRAAGGTVETRQTFTNHPPIAVLLTIDVTSRHGWVVASVRPAP